ncbi:hypothetical protein B0A52_09910 [Exophiala mesophila]|uniref:Uncharacterized protein n=1 Tax=Exophiala mesophila TaxID=212818 RepID=A0A438MQT9_EXOME|nr:hypothetical protein B0A52_09910 [Exophiala mesophila]
MHTYTIGPDAGRTSQAGQATTQTSPPRPQSRLAELATRPFTPFNLWDAPRESPINQPGLEHIVETSPPRPTGHIKPDPSEDDLLSETLSSIGQWQLTHERQTPATTARPRSMFLTVENPAQGSSRPSPATNAANRNSWAAGDRLIIPQEGDLINTTSPTKSSDSAGSVRNKRDSAAFRRDVRLDHWLHDGTNPDCMDCHVESLLDKVEQSFDFDWQLRDGTISSDRSRFLNQAQASSDTRSESNYDEHDHHPGFNSPETDKIELSAEERKVRKLILRKSLRVDTSVAYHAYVPTALPKFQANEFTTTHNSGNFRQSQAEQTTVYRPYRPGAVCDPKPDASVSLQTDAINSRRMISFEIFSDDHLTSSDDGESCNSGYKARKLRMTPKHRAVPSLPQIVAPLRHDQAGDLFDSVGQTMDEIESGAKQQTKGQGRCRLVKRTGRPFGRFSMDQQRDKYLEASTAAASVPSLVKRSWGCSLLPFSRKAT